MLNIHEIGIIGQFVCIFRNAFSIFMCVCYRHYLYSWWFRNFRKRNAYTSFLLMLHTFEWCHLELFWKSKAFIKLKLVQGKKRNIIGDGLVGLRFTLCFVNCFMWYRVWIAIVLFEWIFFLITQSVFILL